MVSILTRNLLIHGTRWTLREQVSLHPGLVQYKLLFSRVWLWCDAMDCSPPGSSIHGISQARKLEWIVQGLHLNPGFLIPSLVLFSLMRAKFRYNIGHPYLRKPMESLGENKTSSITWWSLLPIWGTGFRWKGSQWRLSLHHALMDYLFQGKLFHLVSIFGVKTSSTCSIFPQLGRIKRVVMFPW